MFNQHASSYLESEGGLEHWFGTCCMRLWQVKCILFSCLERTVLTYLQQVLTAQTGN
jgi:hypothetical protein